MKQSLETSQFKFLHFTRINIFCHSKKKCNKGNRIFIKHLTSNQEFKTNALLFCIPEYSTMRKSGSLKKQALSAKHNKQACWRLETVKCDPINSTQHAASVNDNAI